MKRAAKAEVARLEEAVRGADRFYHVLPPDAGDMSAYRGATFCGEVSAAGFVPRRPEHVLCPDCARRVKGRS